MQRAVDELITLMTNVCRPVSRRPVGHRTGRPVVEQFDSQISNVRENPRRRSENEQIRILLELQREQILADCQAEILFTNSRPMMTKEVFESRMK